MTTDGLQRETSTSVDPVPAGVTVRRYTAGARRHPLGQALAWPVHYPARLWQHHVLVWNLSRRQLLGHFRGSVLGAFWVLIQPLFLFAVYYLVFGVVFAARLTPTDTRGSFAAYLFSGILAWGVLAGAPGRICTVAIDYANLVKHAPFPTELLAIPPLAVELVIYAAGTLVLLAVGLATGALDPGLPLLALPAVVLVSVCFALGLGLLLAVGQVFVRDVSHAYGVLVVGWLFLSPVFWRIDFLGERSVLARLLVYNPAFWLLQLHREALGLGAGEPTAFWDHLAAGAVCAILSMTLGYGCFVSQKHKLADLV